MTALWVDTDFGFDDLWALLVLRRLNVSVAGLSLVAGNTPLAQVVRNALGAVRAYGFDMPIWSGADRALNGSNETAENILGPKGMRSRGSHLPEINGQVPSGGVEALKDWLLNTGVTSDRSVLALGPLTNIAQLILRAPDAARRITRLVWMGGSSGRGNHTPEAEFNAWADPEAVRIVARAGMPFDIVDLELCRSVLFGPDDMPATDPLTADLLGGYLDIALSRGRPSMAIYDPTAAVAFGDPHLLCFTPCEVDVITTRGSSYGATRLSADGSGKCRVAIKANPDLARFCLDALTGELRNGA